MPAGVFLTARGGTGFWGASQPGFLAADGDFQDVGGVWTTKRGAVSANSASEVHTVVDQSVGRAEAGSFYKYSGVMQAQAVA